MLGGSRSAGVVQRESFSGSRSAGVVQRAFTRRLGISAGPTQHCLGTAIIGSHSRAVCVCVLSSIQGSQQGLACAAAALHRQPCAHALADGMFSYFYHDVMDAFAPWLQHQLFSITAAVGIWSGTPPSVTCSQYKCPSYGLLLSIIAETIHHL